MSAYNDLVKACDVSSICMFVLVLQSCPTLCDPTDCSLPGFSVHGILQVRIPEGIAIPFSRGTSQPRDWTLISCLAGRFFTIWATGVYKKIISCYQKKKNVLRLIGVQGTKLIKRVFSLHLLVFMFDKYVTTNCLFHTLWSVLMMLNI